MSTLDISLTLQKGTFKLPVKLSLPTAGVIALFGASGTGKTSLLRAVAGLDRPLNASIKIGEQVWQSDSIFVPTHQRSLGYVFQEDNLFPHLTISGNLQLAQRSGAIPQDRLQHLIAQLQLEPYLQRFPWQLSGGEKQKVAIARALALQPTLLLLDEPLSAVDETFKHNFLADLKRLLAKSNITTLYVSHSSAEVATLADSIVYFSKEQPPLAAFASNLLTDLQHPLAQRIDAEAILKATVTHYDTTYGLLGLTCADCEGCELLVGGTPLTLGQQVRLRILAQDVSLTRSPPQASSILNILPVIVSGLAPNQDHSCTVQLQLGTQLLLARITRKSVANLALRQGDHVYAQIKGVAVLH